MRDYIFTVAALTALAAPAFAGGPIVVADDPVPVATAEPMAVHDWSGPYVGLSYGTASGDIDFSTTSPFDVESGNIAGVYAGYLMQRGSLVYGGELAYGRISDAAIVGFPNSDFANALDLKARVGFAANRALFYGVLGYSKAMFDDTAAIEFDMDGFSYGLGVDLAVSNRFTVGLEYLTRDLSGTSSVDPTTTGDASLDTLSLRVGLSF